jgi:hypothetical protein
MIFVEVKVQRVRRNMYSYLSPLDQHLNVHFCFSVKFSCVLCVRESCFHCRDMSSSMVKIVFNEMRRHN